MNSRIDSLIEELKSKEAEATSSALPQQNSFDIQVLLTAENYVINGGDVSKLLKTYNKLLPLTKLAVEKEQSDLLPEDKEYFANLHAIKLAILFGDFKQSVIYLRNFERAMKNVFKFMPIHDACLFTLPKGKGWNVSAWQKILRNGVPNKPSDKIMRVISFAPEIEDAMKKESVPLTNKMKVDILLKYMASVSFKQAVDDPEAARLFLHNGISEAIFDHYLILKENIPAKDEMPEVRIDGLAIHPDYQGFSIEKLAKQDPQAAILGKLTSCCQSLGDAGSDPTAYGLTSPHAGFYVLYQKKGVEKVIVAQCMAWKSKEGYIVFDSIESQVNFREKNKSLLMDFFACLANELVQDHDIPRVLVGTSGQTPNELGSMSPLELPKPINYRGYRDSRSQRIISDKSIQAIIDEQYHANNPETRLLVKLNENQEKFPLEKLKEIYTMFYVINHQYEVENLKRYVESTEADNQLINYAKQLENARNCFAQIDVFGEYECWNKAKLLIEAGVPINMCYMNGETALCLAVKKNNIEIAKWLLDRGANPDIEDDFGSTPLHWVSREGDLEMTLLLVGGGADINADTHRGSTILHESVRNKRWGIAHELINHGANVDTKDVTGCAVLHSVAFYGDLDLLKRLIEEKRVDLSVRDLDKRTILDYAAMGGQANILQYLIEDRGLNPNIEKDGDSIPLLHKVVRAGSVESVKVLIKHGINIQATNNRGETVLHVAACQVADKAELAVSMIKYLINEGLDILTVDNSGNTTVDVFIRYAGYFGSYNDVAKQFILELMDNGTIGLDFLDKDKNLKIRLLFYSIRKGSSKNAMLFLSEYIESKNDKTDSLTILHVAIEAGRLELVKYLFENGVLLESENDNNKALQIAVKFGYQDIVEYLVEEQHCEINSANIPNNPLYQAAYHGQLATFDYLVSAGADINSWCLGAAISNQHFDIVDRVLTSGKLSIDNIMGVVLNLNKIATDLLDRVKVNFAESAIDYVAADKANRVILLINYLFRIGLPLDNIEKIFDIVRSLSEDRLATLEQIFKKFNLMKSGSLYSSNQCDVDYFTEKDEHGSSLLHLLTSINLFEEISLFLTKIPKDMRINCVVDKNDQGETPLHIALRFGMLHQLVKGISIESLLEQHPELKDEFSQAFLHISIQNGSLSDVVYLLEHGVTIDKDCNLSVYFPKNIANTSILDIQLLLIKQGACIKGLTQDQQNRLTCRAASTGQLDAVMLLYPFYHQENEFGKTALHYAAERGCLDIIKYLIERGGDLNAACFDDGDMMAQHYAAKGGHLDVVKYLISKGAEENAADGNGSTMLDYAREAGKEAVVAYLQGIANIGAASYNAESGSPRLFTTARVDTASHIKDNGPSPSKNK